MSENARKNDAEVQLMSHPSGNPYGWIQARDEEEVDLTRVKPWQKKLRTPSGHLQPELNFSPNIAAEGPADHGGNQNPYASLNSIDEDVAVMSRASEPMPHDELQGRISMATFRRRCREVFLQYEPLSSGITRLRPEFAEFISKSEVESPESRAAILERLLKFQIPANLKPRLNRERVESLVEKLKEISEAPPW